jgi:hypothetical protein
LFSHQKHSFCLHVNIGDLHNEELLNFAASPDIRAIKSRRVRWAGHIARMGETRNAYNILVAKPERKRPLRRPRPDNIRIDLRVIVWEHVDWMHLDQERDQRRALVNSFGFHRSDY